MKHSEKIKLFIQNAPMLPGIYQMLDCDKRIIYIGKAKYLKNRLTNYTKSDLHGRIARMVSQIDSIQYTITSSEAAALLLEARLIKKLQPKFNILLKDDKSFPYIKLRLDHDFPQLIKYRGKSLEDGKFFGPFASASHVYSTMAELQKIFKLRSCSDSYFSTRNRPCLQYQIKRCYAPCTGKIDKGDYEKLVWQVENFLTGRNKQLQEELSIQMENFSNEMRFEEAAEIRDRIKALSYVQLKAGIAEGITGDVDVIAIAGDGNQFCVQVFLCRIGQFWGNKAFFPVHTENSIKAEVLTSFLGQFYQTRKPPSNIILSDKINEVELIEIALKELYGSKVKIGYGTRGAKLNLIKNAYDNAKLALEQHNKNMAKNTKMLQEIQSLFNIPSQIERIEIYDNSHIMGAYAVGAMVVAGQEGFNKKEYRTYNIKTLNNVGDDFGMLKEVLSRRFTRMKNEPEKLPQLMIIDGGKGHMNITKEIMDKFNINIPFVCMSKGPNRNAGLEQFHIFGRESFTLDKLTNLMKYLQILRDEAHNYAIKSHRDKRSRAIKVSSLDDVPGIGNIRKKALLNYFGSYKAITGATIEELEKVNGINKAIAQKIFDYTRVD